MSKLILTNVVLSIILVFNMASEDVSFLTSICDDRQRLFCLAALIKLNWLVTTDECKVTSHEKAIKKIIFAGRTTVDCLRGESTEPRSIRRVDSNMMGNPSSLVLIELMKPFKKSSAINKIDMELSPPEVGTICTVYYNENLTDPFEFVQSVALDRRWSPDDGFEIEVASGEIVPCTFLEDNTLVCIKLESSREFRNSPLVCNKKLVGVILFTHEGEILAAKQIGAYIMSMKHIITDLQLYVRSSSNTLKTNFYYSLFFRLACISIFLKNCYQIIY